MSTKPAQFTPIYIKESSDEAWPEDGTFYTLTGSGLFLCRDNEFFRSCVQVQDGPSELPEQLPFLEPRYPPVPQEVIEQLVGFFAVMAERHRCEAGAFLIYDRKKKVVRAHVPNQTSTVSEGWNGALWPVGFDYDNVEALPEGQMILGTIHSHVYGAAYSSGIDVHDEVDKPGIHLVVGKVDLEPPDFHVEAVVDKSRFELDIHSVIEDYRERRDDYPKDWVDRVTVVVTRYGSRVYPKADSGYGGSYNTGTYYGAGDSGGYYASDGGTR